MASFEYTRSYDATTWPRTKPLRLILNGIDAFKGSAFGGFISKAFGQIKLDFTLIVKCEMTVHKGRHKLYNSLGELSYGGREGGTAGKLLCHTKTGGFYLVTNWSKPLFVDDFGAANDTENRAQGTCGTVAILTAACSNTDAL